MAWQRAVKVAVVVAPMVVAGFVVPTREPAGSPAWAVQRAESQGPSLGVLWGKLRAFSREAQGWRLFYQPAHGAWVVTVRVPDLHRPERPSLEAAAWLPGGRLSVSAVRRLSGEEPLGFVEGLARRDWWLREGMVVGTLLVGKPPARKALAPAVSWPLEVAAGLLLAGAVARRIRPQPRALGLRRAVMLGCVFLVFAVVGASRWAWPVFAPGVRPFVSLLLFQAFATLVLATVAASAFVLPAFAHTPSWWSLGLGFCGGWVMGLGIAPHWAVVAAAVPSRWILMLAAPVVAGYLADLAAAGGRLLLSPLRRLAPWVAVVAAGAGLAVGGWGAALAALLLVTAWPPAQAFWFATALAFGFLPGAWWGSVGWWGPLRDSMLLSLLVWAGLLVWALSERRPASAKATIAGCA
ncbi:hypothetical protein HRbin09_00952 [bacterium HR09]|nr:hypothetical protein HRbin09_00952 [bacterium HR09]